MIKKINVQIEISEEKIKQAIEEHGSIEEYISFLVDRDTFLPLEQMDILQDFLGYVETGEVDKRNTRKARLQEFFKFEKEINNI